MTFSLKRPSLTDPKLDLQNFMEMEDLIEMVANAQFDQNFNVKRSGKTMQIGLVSSGSYFPWEQCSFGYKINPDGDNPLEVMIYSGNVDVGRFEDTLFTRTEDTKIIVDNNLNTTIYAMGWCSPGSSPDPGGMVSYVSKTPGSSLWSSFLLYRFTAESGIIDDSKTVIYRFLDIEANDYVSPESVLPSGAIETPHLIWDKVSGVWKADLIYKDYNFGFEFDHSTGEVLVKSGRLRHGTRAPIVVPDSYIHVGTDQTWIYVEYVFGSATASIVASLSEPQTNSLTLKWPLHLWGLGAYGLYYSRICHLGDIIIPGNFA